MDVSVIIVNYNTKDLTKACVDSIFSKTKGVSFEVVLVDNASNDGSKEVFEQDQRIRYVYHHQNVGFGKANNIGYKYTTGKYLLFLNSDTVLVNNAIFELYHYIEHAGASVGCVGCVLSDEYGNQIHSYGSFPTVKSYVSRLLAYYHIRLYNYSDIPDIHSLYPLNVDYVTGADMFVKRQAIEKCGLFDPDFFMYYEETDLQYRFKKHGYVSQVIDTPKIIHLQGASNKQIESRKSLRIAQIELNSRLVYARKNLNYFEGLLVSVLHLLMIPKILFYNALWTEKLDEIVVIILSIKLCFQKC